MKFITRNEQETAKIAEKFAASLKKGQVITLYGDLGAGKSVFCRALIRTALEDTNLNVPSPTFSLVQTYETEAFEIWHFDLYRVEDMEEIYEIGWEEALADGLSLIEWPERIEPLLPSDTIKITFEELDETSRKIIISD